MQYIFHLFPQPPIINTFFILGREEGRNAAGAEMGKGNSSKVDETRRFLTLGIQTGPFVVYY